MSKTAIFLILLSALLHVGWITLSKHEDPTASFFMLANSMGCFLFLPFVFKHWEIYSTILSHIWIYAVVTGCLLALYFASLAKMLQSGDLSTSYPLLSLVSPQRRKIAVRIHDEAAIRPFSVGHFLEFVQP